MHSVSALVRVIELGVTRRACSPHIRLRGWHVRRWGRRRCPVRIYLQQNHTETHSKSQSRKLQLVIFTDTVNLSLYIRRLSFYIYTHFSKKRMYLLILTYPPGLPGLLNPRSFCVNSSMAAFVSSCSASSPTNPRPPDPYPPPPAPLFARTFFNELEAGRENTFHKTTIATPINSRGNLNQVV